MVLSRLDRPKTSQLKCKRCGWKWRSKCKYIDRLPDHVERRVSQITDVDVLARLREGNLVVDTDRAEVRSNGRLLSVSPRQLENHPEYRFVVIYRNSGRKKVALHRIVWMAAHMAVPPDGHDVHHKKHGVRIPDAISNLQLVPSAVNRANRVEEPW